MKLSHLRIVLAVAEFGSLRAAGRQLGIVQPVITRSIREVEQELDAILFERHARGVRLTDIGRAFVRRAGAVETELRRAREEIDQMKGNATGLVSVALSTASSMSLLPSAVTTFRKRFPQARLTISEGFFQQVEKDILSGTIDFYVGPLDQSGVSAQFAVEKLFDNHRMVMARRGHAYRGVRKLADLVDASWIRPASTQNPEADFESVFEEMKLPRPNVVINSRSALITLLMLVNSDLITILPRQWLDFPVTASLLEALELDEPFLAAPICIARRRDMPLTPIAEYLFDMFRRAGTNYAARRPPVL